MEHTCTYTVGMMHTKLKLRDATIKCRIFLSRNFWGKKDLLITDTVNKTSYRFLISIYLQYWQYPLHYTNALCKI